jgi:hypothetical protein
MTTADMPTGMEEEVRVGPQFVFKMRIAGKRRTPLD